MPRPLRPLLFCVLLLAASPAPAPAGFFGAETLDGPNADVARVGGADVARDGTATVVYVRRVSGVEHVFAVRMTDGVWGAPERLDSSLPLPSTEPVVGVANRGAAVVAFLNNGRLHAIVRRPGDTAWPAPVEVAQGAAAPSIDLSVNGVGYLAWAQSGDVRAALLERGTTTFAPLAAPLDIDPAADAGSGTGRPRIAAAADGTALAAWGEGGKVYARRLLRSRPSTLPQQVSVADLGGRPGGEASLPEVDIADDSSFAWVTFQQAFDAGATTRVLARRLVGSVFDPPADVGGGGFGAEAATSPSLDVAGSGDAMFGSETATTRTPFAAISRNDVLGPPFPLSNGNTVASLPEVTMGETSQAVAAWFDTDAGAVGVSARSFKFGKPADGETSLVDFGLGAADGAGGLHAGSDKFGDAIIAFVQGVGTGRRLAVATWDRPPVNLIQRTTFRWRNTRALAWAPISEPWGDITWTVEVDGRTLGTTTANRFPIAGRVSDGVHRWTLTATDRRGQTRAAGPRTVRLDTRGPRLSMAVRGSRTAGSAVRFSLRAGDRLSGLRTVKINFGDGSPTVFGRDVSHRFRAGSHTVTATAVDRAGNRTTRTRRLVVR